MAVPDTNTFSLQDVVDEINPTTDDLQDCVSDAISGDYNSLYYSSPATSLLEFRDYNGVATSQSYNIRIGTSLSLACSGSSYAVVWQVSDSFNFIDPIFTTSAASTYAPSGWRSNGFTVRNWNGSSWLGSSGTCFQ